MYYIIEKVKNELGVICFPITYYEYFEKEEKRKLFNIPLLKSLIRPVGIYPINSKQMNDKGSFKEFVIRSVDVQLDNKGIDYRVVYPDKQSAIRSMNLANYELNQLGINDNTYDVYEIVSLEELINLAHDNGLLTSTSYHSLSEDSEFKQHKTKLCMNSK